MSGAEGRMKTGLITLPRRRVTVEIIPSLTLPMDEQGCQFTPLCHAWEQPPRPVKVITADPPGVFDEAAIEAMNQWVFEPAEQAGVPIKVRLAYPIVFSLAEKKQ